MDRRRPQVLYAYGYRVKIRFKPYVVADDEESCHGTCDDRALIIEISDRFDEQHQRAALFHEILHFAYRTGLQRPLEDEKELPIEETFITLLDKLLWPVLADPKNADLWGWVLGGNSRHAASAGRVQKRSRQQRR